jgi:hypothetical protein
VGWLETEFRRKGKGENRGNNFYQRELREEMKVMEDALSLRENKEGKKSATYGGTLEEVYAPFLSYESRN